MKIKFLLLFIFLLIIVVCIFPTKKSNNFDIFNIENIRKCDARYLLISRSKINTCIPYPNSPNLLLSNTQYTDIKSLLSWSIIYDCKQIFYYLIDNGADVNSMCYHEKKLDAFTPLYYAIHLNRPEYISHLLNASANLEYIGGHFDDESNTFIPTKTYFDVAYNSNKVEAFCELYKYLVKTQFNYIKHFVMEILDNNLDFKLSFLRECSNIPY